MSRAENLICRLVEAKTIKLQKAPLGAKNVLASNLPKAKHLAKKPNKISKSPAFQSKLKKATITDEQPASGEQALMSGGDKEIVELNEGVFGLIVDVGLFKAHPYQPLVIDKKLIPSISTAIVEMITGIAVEAANEYEKKKDAMLVFIGIRFHTNFAAGKELRRSKVVVKSVARMMFGKITHAQEGANEQMYIIEER